MSLKGKFNEVLELLDLSTDTSSNNLLFVNSINNQNLSATELFSLETACLYKATAIYFRKFDDSRNPIPQIYIYDNTQGNINSQNYAETQRALWSSCIIPVFIIIESSQILIFDTRKPVDTFLGTISATPIEVLQITAEAIKEYSAKLFDNGTFWERERNSNYFLESTSAYVDLISGLKKIRKSFLERTNLPKRTAHKLLVLSILVKYLEERGNDSNTLFAKDFFKQFGADDFCGVLRNKGQIVNLFSKLGAHFNGKIFSWDDPNEKNLLADSDLSLLANFLDADSDGVQYVLWRRYSFNHLPVELISSVYEEFIGQAKDDIVYTPHFLVSMLVDECMPLNEPKDNFKLIDASCGSGIFLVSCYKRLVDWRRYKKYLETGKLPAYPKLAELKSILKNSIFGVDIEGDATHLTTFSLALALCDMLTPKQIWTELKFDELHKTNIITKDFFEYFFTSSKKDFDLVIGNPPFIELNSNVFKKLIKDNNIETDCKIPQNQISLLFLQQAMKLLNAKGLLCLIMPSSPLLYNDTLDFRNSFFSKYNVLQIIDFTSLSAVLFGKANVATAALFVCNESPTENSILHVTVRRTKPAKEKNFFEIDHYDFHHVSKHELLNDKYIWKANLLGGGRVNAFINRLSNLTSLKSFLIKKRSENGWYFGEGYSIGNRAAKADHITNHATVKMNDFDEKGIHLISVEYEEKFEAPREAGKLIFKKPHILIKEVVSNNVIPIEYVDFDLTFTNRVVGIYAPENEKDKLIAVSKILKKNNDINVLFLAATSNQYLINKASALLKKDIDNIPFPENEDDLKLSFPERIIQQDILNYRLEQLTKGESAKVNEHAQEDELIQFSETFCMVLNSVYLEEGKSFHLASINFTETCCTLSFNYSETVDRKILKRTSKKNQFISALIENQQAKNIRINRIVKLYDKNGIHLIKPRQLHYWLRSIALRDADEVFNDLINAGY